jgi:hypothetical protein
MEAALGGRLQGRSRLADVAVGAVEQVVDRPAQLGELRVALGIERRDSRLEVAVCGSGARDQELADRRRGRLVPGDAGGRGLALETDPAAPLRLVRSQTNCS